MIVSDWYSGVKSTLSNTFRVLILSAIGIVPGNAENVPDAQFGLPPVPVPLDDPLTEDKVELGRKLFFDDRLSPLGGVSCATCHVPESGFTETDKPRSTGRNGKPLRRNAPTLLNTVYSLLFFHDGRSATLEEQALVPFTDPQEINAPSIGWVVNRVSELDGYKELFGRAFGTPVSADTLARALAAFQRRLVAGDSPFDHWLFGGESSAIGEAAIRGFRIFREKGLCAACHRIGDQYALFMDDKFHDTGIAWRNAQAGDGNAIDRGREEATGYVWERYKIKTPSLRNVALTPPYMHDGSVETLEDVVRFYVKGGIDHPTMSALIGPLELTDRDVADLVAFMESLTSPNAMELAVWSRGAKKR